MSDTQRKPKDMNTSAKLLAYLRQHANVVLSLSEIASETEMTTSRASSAINHLRQRVGLNIEVPSRGMYIYHSNPKQQLNLPRPNQLYEFVGVTRGYTIIRDEQGELYILSPLANLIPKDAR